MTITVTEKEARMVLRGLSANAQHWYDLLHSEAANKEHVYKKFCEAQALIENVRDQLNAQFDEMEAK